MEPSREAISVRLTRLRNQLSGASGTGAAASVKRALHREALLDALTALYDECNNDALKKQDEHIAKFVDKYRCVLTELRRMRVNIDDFQVKELIGRGHFGEVHVVREKLTGDVYAMKRLRKTDTLEQKEVAFYEEERDIMALAVSPWITKLQYAFQDTKHLYLVMEFCPGGDLAGLLERRAEPLSLASATFYLAELNQALAALHTCGFLHRDMKPDNVLIDRCGHLKLADFGSAVRIGQSGRATSRAPIGTPDYIAPELLAAAEHTQPATHGAAVDYWSLGVIAYEMVSLRTPFSEKNKISSAHTFNNIQRYREGKFHISWPTKGPSDSQNEGPTEEYKDLVACLLRVDPLKRYNYLEMLRHPAMKDLSWNTIRDQVPPFVPIVRSTDDTSHFSECDRVAPRASAATLRNFRSKTAFSGNNLPFIGFTYTPESYVCCSHGADSSSGSSGGFNSTLNTTAVHLASYREVEKLAERRGAEIAALQQRAAAAETEAVLQRERERHLASLEQQRSKLEQEVTDLIVHNQKLTRQLEMEHEERQDLERKSLELIEAAKHKWVEKNRSKTEQLRTQIANQELRIKDKTNENDALRKKIEELNAELKNAATEAEAMRKLQLNFKDSMAKARAVSRASIAGLASADLNGSNELARERDLRRTAEAQANIVAEKIRRLEDGETALRVELNESRKDYADIKERYASLESECRKLRCEADSTVHVRDNLERRNRQLEVRVKELEQLVAADKRDAAALRDTIEDLNRQLSESHRKEVSLEEQHARTTARLTDKMAAAQQQCVSAQARLATATQSEDRHRDKITELEGLVMKLEREVSKLETQRGGGSGAGAAAQVQLLKEQLAASDQQLQETREELTKLKQESRKTNMALWKKEKELADSELDKRISARELKAAEEKVAKLTESRRKATEAAAEEKKRLEAALLAAETSAEETKKLLDETKEKLEATEKKLTLYQDTNKEWRDAEDKLNAEIDRYKNDIRKLKCELQYSENRRLRTEASIDKEREELRKAHDDRLTVHEEVASLRASLEERTRTVENLELNNKVLQEACSMLEEQLTDMERLSDLHENKSKNLEGELSRVRSELESCRASLQQAESRAAEGEQRAGSAARQHIDAEEYIETLHKQINSLQEHMREKEMRYSELELAEAALSAERDSLQRKLSSAGHRLQQLQEECSTLLTSTHQLTADNIRLQHQLKEAQEETEASREASEAAAAWWRTRETKADATLRQQAKLIDFLQSKVEEAGRKKKTLTDMLFGHRVHKDKDGAQLSSTSSDITRALVKERQANRELRDELNLLKSQLPANSPLLFGTKKSPRAEKNNKNGYHQITNGNSKPMEQSDRYLRLVRDGVIGSQRVSARTEDGLLVWRAGMTESRARLLTPTATHTNNLSQADIRNSFSVRTVTSSEEDSECITVVCESGADRTHWLSQLAAPGAGPVAAAGLGYAPRALLPAPTLGPKCVVEVKPGLYAIGTENGLYSYQAGHSPVSIATPSATVIESLHIVIQASRVLILSRGELLSADLRCFLSVLERRAFVSPELRTDNVPLPHSTKVTFVEVMPRRYSADRSLVAAVSARRMLLLTCDVSAGWRTLRIVELTAPPQHVLFTPHTLLVAADTAYEVDLQRYNVEEFLDDSDATLEAVSRNSCPKAILSIKDRAQDEETEYLLCYEQVGVFVDEFGRRTRSEDVKWSGSPVDWEYRKPYLFIIESDRVEVSKLEDDHFKVPPCQCDTTSIESGSYDPVVPEKCVVKLQSPVVIGHANKAGAIIVKEGAGKNCSIVEIDATAALRKIGLSVETLDCDYSEVDFPGAIDEPDAVASDSESTSTQDTSEECQSNFLADIRRRAKQIRGKVQEQQRKEEAIREILSTEISAKFVPRTRRNSNDSLESDFSAESSVNGEKADSVSLNSAGECHVVGRTTADVCNDMFLKKTVRFDGK